MLKPIVGLLVGHLTDLVLTGEGIFESFFDRRGDRGDIRELKNHDEVHDDDVC